MAWIAVAMALSGPAKPPEAAVSVSPWFTGGSLYRGEAVHVGFRPAGFLDNEASPWEWGVGATLQISTFALQ